MPQTQYTILYFNSLLYKHLESSLIRIPYFMSKYHTLDIFLAQFIFFDIILVPFPFKLAQVSTYTQDTSNCEFYATQVFRSQNI